MVSSVVSLRAVVSLTLLGCLKVMVWTQCLRVMHSSTGVDPPTTPGAFVDGVEGLRVARLAYLEHYAHVCSAVDVAIFICRDVEGV
jgi:hypothetical protein